MLLLCEIDELQDKTATTVSMSLVGRRRGLPILIGTGRISCWTGISTLSAAGTRDAGVRDSQNKK